MPNAKPKPTCIIIKPTIPTSPLTAPLPVNSFATLTVALPVALAILIMRFPVERRWIVALLVVEAVQVLVGIAQARLGLPEVLVGVHMVLAAALVAAMTAVILSLRPKAAAQPTMPVELRDRVASS